MCLFLCPISVCCTDFETFVFEVFGNCRRQLKFTVRFQVNDCKYQNILWTRIFANFPRWELYEIQKSAIKQGKIRNPLIKKAKSFDQKSHCSHVTLLANCCSIKMLLEGSFLKNLISGRKTTTTITKQKQKQLLSYNISQEAFNKLFTWQFF